MESAKRQPHQFVMRYRAERPAELLVDRTMPVSDVLAACDFSDQPHLTRVFKQMKGQTPKE